MERYLFWFAAAAIVIPPTVIVIWHQYRHYMILRQWEAHQPYTWVEYKWQRNYELSLRDAFSRETFYQITVRNRKGRIRHGWLRCGSWWLGSFTNRVQVSWEPYEKQPNRAQRAKRAGGSTATSKKKRYS
jgi:hypothetical protein